MVDIEDRGAFGGANGNEAFVGCYGGGIFLRGGDFGECALDGFGGNGFEEVVDGGELEGAEGVVFVGGGEDDFMEEFVGAEEFEQFGAFVEGHVDIEEDDIGF